MTKDGIFVKKTLPLIYDEVKINVGYHIDLFVENKEVEETKYVDLLNDVHTAYVLTCLKLTQCKVGLLINFNVADLRRGD